MKNKKMMKSNSILALIFTMTSVCSTLVPSHALPRQRARTLASPCGNAVSDWFKGAYDYLKHGQVSAGKRPAIYATVSLVSQDKPQALAGQIPDRTAVWYAQGEVVDSGLPVYVQFDGKLPMWINSGDPSVPFGTQTPSTLSVTLSETGAQTFNWQVGGRNRLGQGPQPFALNAQTAQMTPDFLLYTGTLNFHGMKQITLTLVRGEADAQSAQKTKPVGTRYRITPTFVVVSSNDGVADNTVEVQSGVSFFHNGQPVSFLKANGDAQAGKRFVSTPFEVVRLDDKPETYKIEIKGKISDYDPVHSDTLWNRPMSVSIKAIVQSKNGTLSIDPGFAPGNDAYGNLELHIEKLDDVY